MALRKTIELELLDEAVALDIDFRLLEIVERSFNSSIDLIVSRLAMPEQVPRRIVADVVCDWITRRPEVALKRLEVRQFVMTAPPEKYYPLPGALLVACLYARNEMTDEELERAKVVLKEAKQPKARTDENDEGAGKKTA